MYRDRGPEPVVAEKEVEAYRDNFLPVAVRVSGPELVVRVRGEDTPSPHSPPPPCAMHRHIPGSGVDGQEGDPPCAPRAHSNGGGG